MPNKWLRALLIAIGALLVLCICLGAGIFAVRLNNRGVGRPIGLFRRMFFLSSGHGAIGTIQGLDSQTITIILRDGTTQSVLVNSQTRLEQNRKKTSLSDLKVDDRIAVIGTPDNQDHIIARWIHVLNPGDSESTPVPPTPTQFR